MSSPGHTVAETAPYLADCRHSGLSGEERSHIVNAVAAEPQGGDVIVGSGGAREVRVAAPGRGKSGGYRLISAYLGATIPVYLLALYAKNERANLSDAEVNSLKQVLTETKRYWKEKAR